MRAGRQYSYAGRVILIALLAVILISIQGCTTAEYVDRVVYVDKPVAVPCVRKDQVPAIPKFATRSLSGGSTIDAVSKSYMIELTQRDAYEHELYAIVSICALLDEPEFTQERDR
jgi:hypothetical protein